MRFSIIIGVIFILFQIGNCQRPAHLNRLSFFDIDLLRYAAEDKKGNVMISPASIKSSLAMLLEGAKGNTAAEIKSALRVSPEKDDFREELKVYLKAFGANNTTVSLQNANALFVSKKLKLRKEFEVIVKNFYMAEINELNFNDAKSSADTVNHWVDTKTHGLIPRLVDEDQITPSTEMMVTNALYFKASWKHGFNPKMTSIDCFYREGVCTKVAMMYLKAELNYAYIEDLRAHALELPYEDDRYSMILLVPKDRDAGVVMIRDLPYIGIPQIIKMMDPIEVYLTMPKFDIEYSEDMTEPLRKMHITTLFSQAANLSGVFGSDELAYLNSIYHSVHMKVDEAGTIAAAASSSVVVPLINDHLNLQIDRPFLFFIRDNKLEVILFEGKIEAPKVLVEPTSSKDKPQVIQPTIRTHVSETSDQSNIKLLHQDGSSVKQANAVLFDYGQDTSGHRISSQEDYIHKTTPVSKPVLHQDIGQPDPSPFSPVVTQTTTENYSNPRRFFNLVGKRFQDLFCVTCY